MRIVAGKFRGINLAKSDHLKELRPTTDKNRESLFNILNSGKSLRETNFKFDGAEILDVCCGTGAVAFEALSRGAKSAFLIDKNREHLEVARKNAQLLKVENCVEFLCADAKKLPQNEKNFDLIFIDPPYAEDYSALIESLLEKNWIKKSALIVVEFETNKEPDFSSKNFQLLDSRQYGRTTFAFLTSQ